MDANESVLRDIFTTNLARLFRETGKMKKDLADYVGVSQNTVTSWVRGVKTPRMDKIDMISRFFHVDRSDLLELKVTLNADTRRTVKIPVYGAIACGTPITAIGESDDEAEIPEEWTHGGREYFGLIAKGDSMFPRICDGDTVIIEKMPEIESGQIGAVMVNSDEATLKKVIFQDNGIMLVAFNTAEYEPHFYTAEEVRSLPIRILGRAVERRSKL